MLAYTEDDKICRSRQLLAYFGQKQEHSCGICDVCIANKKSTLSAEDFEATLQIVKTQLSKGPITFKGLVNHTNIPEDKATSVVRFLLDRHTIIIDNRQLLTLISEATHNAQ